MDTGRKFVLYWPCSNTLVHTHSILWKVTGGSGRTKMELEILRLAMNCFTCELESVDAIFICSSSARWRRQRHRTPVLLPGKSHGQRSLVGRSPWGLEESDTTEQLHFYFSLSCIGEGNGNPLQCSCLENPRDGGAWWATVYGAAESWTQLKQLSSSSSSSIGQK